MTLLAWVRAPSNPGDSRYVAGLGGGGSCTPAAYAMYTLYGSLYSGFELATSTS